MRYTVWSLRFLAREFFPTRDDHIAVLRRDLHAVALAVELLGGDKSSSRTSINIGNGIACFAVVAVRVSVEERQASLLGEHRTFALGLSPKHLFDCSPAITFLCFLHHVKSIGSCW